MLAIGALEALQAVDGVRLEWPEGKSLTEAGECRLSFSGMAKERGWFEALAALRNGVGDYIRLLEGRFLRLTEGLRRKLAILDAASRRNFDAVEVSPAAVLPLTPEALMKLFG